MSSRLERGCTVWLTGLPSAGKTTIARALEKRLLDDGHRVEVLDGDQIRPWLSPHMGYSKADRDEHIVRVGRVADLLSRNGVVVLVPVVSPYRAARDEVRSFHGDRFVEVYVAAPADVCQERDVKGLYAKAKAGEITGMTGYDDPYEPPLAPEVVIDTHTQTLEESVETLWRSLQG